MEKIRAALAEAGLATEVVLVVMGAITKSGVDVYPEKMIESSGYEGKYETRPVSETMNCPHCENRFHSEYSAACGCAVCYRCCADRMCRRPSPRPSPTPPPSPKRRCVEQSESDE